MGEKEGRKKGRGEEEETEVDKNEARERGEGEGEGRVKRMKDEFCPSKSQMLPGTLSIPMLNTSML